MVSAEPESVMERPAYLNWPEEEKKEICLYNAIDGGLSWRISTKRNLDI